MGARVRDLRRQQSATRQQSLHSRHNRRLLGKRREREESQRDSGHQPRVARHELPWENKPTFSSTPTGLWRNGMTGRTQPCWGWGKITTCVTQGSLADSATLGWRTKRRWRFHLAGLKASLRTAWRRWAAWVRVCAICAANIRQLVSSASTRATIAACSACGGSGRNPNGIQAISPGLRGTSYPGKTNPHFHQPQRGCGATA